MCFPKSPRKMKTILNNQTINIPETPGITLQRGFHSEGTKATTIDFSHIHVELSLLWEGGTQMEK